MTAPDSILAAETPAPRKPPRDTCTRLWKAGRLSLLFEPRDLWVGVYVSPRAVFVCVVPRLVLKWERRCA